MVNKVAFFDIDGTIYRDSLMVEHFRTLLDFDLMVSEKHATQAYKDWYKRQGDYEDYLDAVSKVYVEELKNLTKTDVEFTGRYVIKKKSDRVYKFTRSMLQKHKKEGHLIIFISGSPDFLVEAMGKKHHAFLAIGSKYIMKNNYFTGEVIPMWDAESKNKTIDRLVEEYNIDLDKSYAYGDTNGDYNMLHRVGNPVAMNPSKELFTKIKANEELAKKATILIERKDVIYKTKADIDILEL